MSEYKPTLKELNSLSCLIKEVDALSELLNKVRSSLYAECEAEHIEFKLVSKIEESKSAYQKILQWMFSIDDPLVRLILEERFLNCNPWEQVACRVGVNNTEYSVKQMAYRYLENEEV